MFIRKSKYKQLEEDFKILHKMSIDRLRISSEIFCHLMEENCKLAGVAYHIRELTNMEMILNLREQYDK